LLAEAVAWLAIARLALLFVPFRKLAARFGTVVPAGAVTVPTLQTPSPSQQEQAREVGWAVTRAARYVPFRAVCLPQAIAAKAMLDRRRVGSVMHFGILRKTVPLAAHAWLDSGNVEVTGFPLGPEIAEIARFL
jgi:Transglutaminase-like superfamily